MHPVPLHLVWDLVASSSGSSSAFVSPSFTSPYKGSKKELKERRSTKEGEHVTDDKKHDKDSGKGSPGRCGPPESNSTILYGWGETRISELYGYLHVRVLVQSITGCFLWMYVLVRCIWSIWSIWSEVYRVRSTEYNVQENPQTRIHMWR